MADSGATLPRDFSRVVLTLENVLIPDEKLSVTPSMLDGLDKEIEQDLRILGCEMIQTAGILLKLPQTAMATGQVLFQRFYHSKSFVKHNMEVLAMACMNLASKIEESPKRIRDVINVFHHIKQVRSKRNMHPLVLDQHYINLKNQVIKAERRLLKETGFCVHVKHPHKIVVSYLQILELVDNHKLTQSSWNFMNDSLRTDVFLRFHPTAIACACIFLAARQLQIPLPNKPPWYALFSVELSSIESICLAILRLYSRPKPNFEKLEKIVEEAKKHQLEAKLKARIGLNSLDGTPNSVSVTNSPKNTSSPNPAAVKKIKTEDSNRSENGSTEEKNGQKGKRQRDSDRSPSRGRSRSHSRSRSSRSHSQSRSNSPPSKKKKRSYSPLRRHKKDKYDDYDDYYYPKDKRSTKRKRRARSRSLSQSPPRYSSKASKKYPKEKRRSHSPLEKSHRSRKHRNGHRDASPRERFDKYEKYRR